MWTVKTYKFTNLVEATSIMCTSAKELADGKVVLAASSTVDVNVWG